MHFFHLLSISSINKKKLINLQSHHIFVPGHLYRPLHTLNHLPDTLDHIHNTPRSHSAHYDHTFHILHLNYLNHYPFGHLLKFVKKSFYELFLFQKYIMILKLLTIYLCFCSHLQPTHNSFHHPLSVLHTNTRNNPVDFDIQRSVNRTWHPLHIRQCPRNHHHQHRIPVYIDNSNYRLHLLLGIFI